MFVALSLGSLLRLPTTSEEMIRGARKYETDSMTRFTKGGLGDPDQFGEGSPQFVQKSSSRVLIELQFVHIT